MVLGWRYLPSSDPYAVDQAWTVRGFHVYRRAGNGWMRLTPLPSVSTLDVADVFADIGLANGAAQQYGVRVVDAMGHEGPKSTSVSAVPAAVGTVADWGEPITATWWRSSAFDCLQARRCTVAST